MANEKMSVEKHDPGAGEKSGNLDKYSELMKRQWGDTAEERAKYPAEH